MFGSYLIFIIIIVYYKSKKDQDPKSSKYLQSMFKMYLIKNLTIGKLLKLISI